MGPQAKTPTASAGSLTFSLPSGPIRMIHPTPSTPHTTINSIPPASGWSAPLHWHETHTEHFRVKQGFAFVQYGNTTRILGPGDGTVEVLPFMLHGFGRADAPGVAAACLEATMPPGFDAAQPDWRRQDVDVEEWTAPADGRKEVFFRNTMSYYADFVQPLLAGSDWRVGDLPSLVARACQMLFCVSYMDNYMLLVGERLGKRSDGRPTFLARMATYALFAVVGGLGRACGWRFWWEEYTPAPLRAVCREMEAQGQDGKSRRV